VKKLLIIAAMLACTSTYASWRYQTDSDAMTSKKTTHAILESSNSLNLSSPYKGTNYGTITVRKHPRWGTNVMFSIGQGQLMCSSYDCKIQARFDDQTPVIFTGTESEDRDSTVIFLQNSSKFIGLAKKAKRILIQASIYQNGAPVLEFFAPTPLEWAPK